MDEPYRIWLSWNNREDEIELPVLPAEIGASIGGDGDEHTVFKFGKINVIKDRGLAEYTIESIFPVSWPARHEPEKQSDAKLLPPFISVASPLRPMDYVDKIMQWWETGRPIRFIFSGAYTQRISEEKIDYDINTAASIESFEWKEAAGSPGDIAYSLKLKEYRFYQAERIPPEALQEPGAVPKPQPARPDERVRPATYTLVPGDSLWKVARKLLGDGARWREIQELNGIGDAQIRSLPVGLVLKIPADGGGAGD